MAELKDIQDVNVESSESLENTSKLVPKVFDADSTAKIHRQVEFYFSDSNLPRDKFLLEKFKEGNGFVSLPLICTFSRMRSHLGIKDPTEEIPPEVVAGVAKIVEHSKVVKVSQDGLLIGRQGPLLSPEEAMAAMDARSLIASPFPWDSKMEDVQKVFAVLAEVKSVRLRRHFSTKDFNGTAFVEFASPEEMQKVAAMEIVANGIKIKMEPRTEFEERQRKERAEKGLLPVDRETDFVDASQGNENRKRKASETEAEPEREFLYTKGVILAFSLSEGKKEEEEGEGKKKGVEVGEKVSVEKENGSGEKEGGEEEKEDEEIKEDVGGEEEKKGQNGRRGGAVSEATIGREHIKEAFSKYGTVKFVDFKYGDFSGFVRFESPEAATEALKGEGQLIKDRQLDNLKVLEGAPEVEYWDAVKVGQTAKRKQDNKPWRGRGGGRGRGRGRGNHGGGHKRY